MSNVLEVIEAYQQKEPDSVSEVIEELKKHIDRQIFLRREFNARWCQQTQHTSR